MQQSSNASKRWWLRAGPKASNARIAPASASFSPATAVWPPAVGVLPVRLPVVEHRGHRHGAHQAAPDGVVPGHMYPPSTRAASARWRSNATWVCPTRAPGLSNKLMQTMAQHDAGYRLQGRVEIDDAYLGRERERAASTAGARRPTKRPLWRPCRPCLTVAPCT